MNNIDIMFNKRADLIAALEKRIPVLEQYDREALALHKQQEKEALKAFRAECLRLSKLSYEEAKQYARYGPHSKLSYTVKMPQCPQSLADSARKAITTLNLSSQEKFRIASNGKYYIIHNLLTFDPNDKPEMC